MLPIPSYRLEQLAKMGLPEQVFIPALLQELHHEIPSRINTFCWQNSEGKLDNIYDESLNTTVITHFISAMSSNGTDMYTKTTEWVSTLNKITTSYEFYRKCPYVADFYKKILRPMGYQNSCFVPIIDQDANKRHGILMLHRRRSDGDFIENERQYLSHVAKIIVMASKQFVNPEVFTMDGWEQGMLVLDSKGKLQKGCTMGLKLLAMASSSKFNQSTTKTPNDLSIFNGLKELIQSISSDSYRHLHQCADPTLTVANAWGEFRLRAFLTEDVNDSKTMEIGLTISWQEPFILKLFHRIKRLNLTPRQESVGLFYANGDHLQVIAEKLGISLHTIKEHIKNITLRLNIKTRSDLVALILCDKIFID